MFWFENNSNKNVENRCVNLEIRNQNYEEKEIPEKSDRRVIVVVLTHRGLTRAECKSQQNEVTLLSFDRRRSREHTHIKESPKTKYPKKTKR